MLLGALPQNPDAHVLRRRRVGRGEPVARARKDRLALGALLAQKLLERRHIGLLELAADAREPVGMQLDLGHARGFTRATRACPVLSSGEWQLATETSRGSSLWRSHGEVAARRADGGALALPLLPLPHSLSARGPPPHGFAPGRNGNGRFPPKATA